MTKVITALTIMKQSPYKVGEPGKTYTITADDEALYRMYVAKNGSVAPIKAGQTITQYQAMQALLLASANNLADSLVIWNFGSMDAYLVAANDLVQSYGLTNTTVSDASGFSPQTTSTPSNMVVLGQKVLSDPVIASIVSQQEANIPGVGIVRNTNKLLTDKSVIGIKTGTTDEAGNCLLFAATHNVDETHSVTIIGVIMGQTSSPNVFRDSRALLDAAATHFAAVTVVPSGTVVGSVTSPWGQKTNLVTQQDLTVYAWKGKALQTSIKLSQVSTPLKAGQQIGSVELAQENTTQVAVVSQDSITAPSSMWRLQNVL